MEGSTGLIDGPRPEEIDLGGEARAGSDRNGRNCNLSQRLRHRRVSPAGAGPRGGGDLIEQASKPSASETRPRSPAEEEARSSLADHSGAGATAGGHSPRRRRCCQLLMWDSLAIGWSTWLLSLSRSFFPRLHNVLFNILPTVFFYVSSSSLFLSHLFFISLSLSLES